MSKFFQLITIMQRHHGLLHLDHGSRDLLDTLVQREEAGSLTTAEDLIQTSTLSRATVYRKIKELTDDGIFNQTWQDHRLVYNVGLNVKDFCTEFSQKFKTA